MIPILFAIWGCIPELSENCIDMTNSSSAYLGIVLGAAVGAIVSWWIYNRQKVTTAKQDHILSRISDIEESHTKILKQLADFDDKHESSFDAIQKLDSKLDALLNKFEDKSSN